MPERRSKDESDDFDLLALLNKVVDKTETDIADVNVDSLDLAEAPKLATHARNTVRGVRNAVEAIKKLTNSRPPVRVPSSVPNVSIPLPQDLQDLLRKPSRVAASSRSAKFLSKLPYIEAGILTYEAASLAKSPEKRARAVAQFEEMGEREGRSGAAKNAAQGFFDPVGTIYGAANSLEYTKDVIKKVGLRNFLKAMVE